jgi:hypothetical protein
MQDKYYDVLCNALKQRLSLTIYYQGHKREVCPYVLGVKAGLRQCLFFQFAGSSEPELPPEGEWKCIPLNELKIFRLYVGPCQHSNSNLRPDHCMDAVDMVTAC